MNDKINMNWNLDNTYTKLSQMFYSNIKLNPVSSPTLVILNEQLATQLGIDTKLLKTKEGVEILSGNKYIENGAYISQAYAGHQFGNFTMLGDGRALLIGEIITPSNHRYDISLKGSGKTPYSRGGDGRAVLSPMLREYIISEAMNALHIPTTRSLAVVKTGEKVQREDIKQGAILTRIAKSHIRFGTFQYAAYFGGVDKVKELADYTIDRHFPHIKEDNKYIGLLKEVIKLQASLVAKWQSVGFIHGVLNTDNMTLSGETIDYGPCAFMDTYNPDTVFSSIDIHGRYSYKNQPSIIEWNLYRFAETIISLLNENQDEAMKIAKEALSEFNEIYYKNYMNNMRNKLGIFNEEIMDKALIEDLLSMIQKYKEDYTNAFVALTLNNGNKGMYESEEFKNWYNIYQERLKRQPQSADEVTKLMKASNPFVIPRNHRVEEALLSANKGDFSVIDKLLQVLKNPYEYSQDKKEYTKLPKVSKYPYKTYCGT